jgi:Mannosyltransferase putative
VQKEIVPGLVDPIQGVELPPPRTKWVKSTHVIRQHIKALRELAATPIPGPRL